jgi:anti-sigma B factor antagonist
MDVRDVVAPPSAQDDAPLLGKVLGKQENEIHDRVVSSRAMNISVRREKDVAIVDFEGRLAVGVGDSLLPQIVSDLLAEGVRKILLNLSQMDYIDSNGLGELVQSLKTSKRFGASLRLLKPQDRVANTLRLTNLLPMFAVYESEADALEAFAQS